MTQSRLTHGTHGLTHRSAHWSGWHTLRGTHGHTASHDLVGHFAALGVHVGVHSLHASAHGRLFGSLAMLRLKCVVGTMHHSTSGVVHGLVTMFLVRFVVFGVNFATFFELQTD